MELAVCFYIGCNCRIWLLASPAEVGSLARSHFHCELALSIYWSRIPYKNCTCTLRTTYRFQQILVPLGGESAMTTISYDMLHVCIQCSTMPSPHRSTIFPSQALKCFFYWKVHISTNRWLPQNSRPHAVSILAPEVEGLIWSCRVSTDLRQIPRLCK